MLLNKYYKVVYNSIFIIVDCYIKIIRYISITIRINIAELIKVFFNKIVLYFKTSANIISNRKSVFINIFWFAIYFYTQIRRQLSIVIYS